MFASASANYLFAAASVSTAFILDIAADAKLSRAIMTSTAIVL